MVRIFHQEVTKNMSMVVFIECVVNVWREQKTSNFIYTYILKYQIHFFNVFLIDFGLWYSNMFVFCLCVFGGFCCFFVG